VEDDLDGRLRGVSMLASALSGKPMMVSPAAEGCSPGSPSVPLTTSPTSGRPDSPTPSGTSDTRNTAGIGAPCARCGRGSRHRRRRTTTPGISARRPLARLGVGPERRHRRYQGDGIDIDAAALAGAAPDEAVFLDSLRRRRDLSVLLLDVSGSAAEPGTVGRSVHEQPRAAAARTVGARRTSSPVKRFDDHLDARDQAAEQSGTRFVLAARRAQRGRERRARHGQRR
jgi:hypothetical protein